MVKKLLIKKKGKTLPELTQTIPPSGIITFGNDPAATVELNDSVAAPEQFVIICETDRLTLMARADGTEINGTPLPRGALHDIAPNDVITVEDYTLILEPAENNQTMETAGNPSGEHDAETAPTSKKSAEREHDVSVDNSNATGARSLSDVLEGLRSEEKFYFQIEDDTTEKRLIHIETGEMWLGWTGSGECILTDAAEEIEVPEAQIRKDWSGVVLYPLHSRGILLNGELALEPKRLRNDDSLSMVSRTGGRRGRETEIRFHEPTALLVLDSILPKELPPPVLLSDRSRFANPRFEDPGSAIDLSADASSISPNATRSLVFRYFTVTEIIIFAIGTIVTAAVIFLILEFY